MKCIEVDRHNGSASDVFLASLTRLPTRYDLPSRPVFLLFLFLVLPSMLRSQSLGPPLQLQFDVLTATSKSSLLVWDVRQQQRLAGVREEALSSPRCVGSLIKPFLLLAYLKSREGKQAQPMLRPCEGDSSWCPVDCWFKPGHGSLDDSRALAFSCNPYFYQLAERTQPEVFFQTLDALGIEPAGPLLEHRRGKLASSRTAPLALIGADPDLRFVPTQVFKAYLALVSSAPVAAGRSLTSSFPANALTAVAEGFRLSASEGTSVLAQQALPKNQYLIGKTGTSPALVDGRYRRDRTDGWFIGLWPASEPAIAVLLLYPNGLGAKHAAAQGGQAIRACLELLR